MFCLLSNVLSSSIGSSSSSSIGSSGSTSVGDRPQTTSTATATAVRHFPLHHQLVYNGRRRSMGVVVVIVGGGGGDTSGDRVAVVISDRKIVSLNQTERWQCCANYGGDGGG